MLKIYEFWGAKKRSINMEEVREPLGKLYLFSNVTPQLLDFTGKSKSWVKNSLSPIKFKKIVYLKRLTCAHSLQIYA